MSSGSRDELWAKEYYSKCLPSAHVEEIQLKFCIEALRAELWREGLLISDMRQKLKFPIEGNAKKVSDNFHYLQVSSLQKTPKCNRVIRLHTVKDFQQCFRECNYAVRQNSEHVKRVREH